MLRGSLLAAALALASPALAADGPLCADCFTLPGNPTAHPLRVEIESGLQFSRLALKGAGPWALLRGKGLRNMAPSGQKREPQAQGRARVTGEPLRPVRIQLPPRVVLHSPDGSEAVLTDFATNLPAVAMLDQSGTLEFAFGARLSTQGAVGGNFRGRIRIEVDYF